MRYPEHLIQNPEVTCYFEFHPSPDDQEARKDLRRYVSLLDDYYHEKGIEDKVGFQTFFLPGEIIKNAYYHGGGKTHVVHFGIALSPESVVIGCCDGGDYFKRPEIKEMWERRIPVASSGVQRDGEGRFISGANAGNEIIYGFTDEIFVDTASGTLFGQFNPRIYLLSHDEIVKILTERKLQKS